uniref:G-protein coupled receptors family 3 profile domain-containing protein n=1 Tax=Gadus morhua TaxID=8049 RepID=A0A8C5ABA4_GADMO
MRAIRQRNITGIQWIAGEAWATVKSLWEEFGDLLSGTLGFGIRRAEEIPGLKQHLSRLRRSNLQDSAFLTEFWEESLNCRLNGSVNTHSHMLRVSYNVYKAVYLVAHALQRMSDCEAGQGPFAVRSVCSESCPPGKRVARRKGKPVCCFDCVTYSLDCTRCPEDMWPNDMRNLCHQKNVEFLSYQEPMGIVLCAGSVLGACLSLLVLVMFYKHRATPVVRANNMELSFFLLLFMATCFLIGLLFIAFGISFALCISCLLAKTVVVLMAFRATLPGSGVMKWFGPSQQRASVLVCTVVQVKIALN